jgi:hypothetical protein
MPTGSPADPADAGLIAAGSPTEHLSELPETRAERQGLLAGVEHNTNDHVVAQAVSEMSQPPEVVSANCGCHAALTRTVDLDHARVSKRCRDRSSGVTWKDTADRGPRHTRHAAMSARRVNLAAQYPLI